MTTFNTSVARNIAEENMAHTSLDVAKNMNNFLESGVANDLSDKLIALELFAIGEHAARCGAYQVTNDLFADLQWNLNINKYGIWVCRVPGLNKVVFHLSDGQWSTRTKDIGVLREFLSKVVKDERNNKMFTK